MTFVANNECKKQRPNECHVNEDDDDAAQSDSKRPVTFLPFCRDGMDVEMEFGCGYSVQCISTKQTHTTPPSATIAASLGRDLWLKISQLRAALHAPQDQQNANTYVFGPVSEVDISGSEEGVWAVRLTCIVLMQHTRATNPSAG